MASQAHTGTVSPNLTSSATNASGRKKDIVLILDGGGMMGIFTAGVLSAINKKLRRRISAVYSTSSGADVGVYFVSDQTHIPLRFFTEYLTKPNFIRKNFFRYVLKIFFFRNTPYLKIKDYINVEYVVEVAKNSDCKLDGGAFEKSNVRFYVKVVDVISGTSVYLPAKTNVFEKLKATSQCGPFSTKAIEVEGKKYIDGGTFPTELDVEVVKKNENALFIFVQARKDKWLSKILLYPLYLLAGHAITVLYGRHLGRKYIQRLFTDPTAKLASCENVIFIKNDMPYSSFCTNKKKLERVYSHGIEKARAAINAL